MKKKNTCAQLLAMATGELLECNSVFLKDVEYAKK